MNELYFNDETKKNTRELRKLFNLLLDYLTKEMKLKDVILSASIVNENRIHEINKKYRDIDRPTDVISFAYNDLKDENEPFLDLGDIYICLEVAFKQAQKYNHPVEREIAFLFIHGFLHLNGYDHIKQEDADIMFELQNKLLNNFKYEYKELKNIL